MSAVAVESGLQQPLLNVVKTDEQLEDSGLTLSWLLQMLSKHCPDYRAALGNGRVKEVTCRDISEGKGFVSKVYKTVLHFREAPHESFTVMMKVPTTEHLDKILEEIRKEDPDKEVPSSILDVIECHNVECKVYEAFRRLDCLPLPTVWYTREAGKGTVGVILMNDLSGENVCPGIISSLTGQQVKNANRYLADFHAHMLAMSPTETAEWERIPHSRLLHIDDYGGEFQHDQLKRIPECQAGELSELLKKVGPALEKEFAQYAVIDRPQQLGIPLLLCHGDAGAHNIFFKAAADGTASNEIGAFIDWQIAFKGSPMHDICRVLYPFCDADVRRDVETTIVEEYYDRLAAETRKKGLKLSFNVEQLREAYSLAAVHQALEMGIRIVHVIEFKKDDFSAAVLDAWRQKLLLRAKLALRDSIEMLRKYAPQFVT